MQEQVGGPDNLTIQGTEEFSVKVALNLDTFQGNWATEVPGGLGSEAVLCRK